MDKIIYMCICDSTYPRKLAFSYLDELSKEFSQSYGDKVQSASRPYAFMGFGESRLDACRLGSKLELAGVFLVHRSSWGCSLYSWGGGEGGSSLHGRPSELTA